MKAPVAGVVFDMDGVLIEARDWHFEALNEALAIFGASIGREEHLARFDGLPTKVKLRMLSDEGRIPFGVFEIIEKVKQERTLRVAARLCFPRIEHLLLFSELKRKGIKIGVATNSIQLTAASMLNFAGILSYLDVLVTNQDVVNPKPDPEIYRLACSRLDLIPSQVVVVEDNHYGVEAAMAAGCRVFKVSNPGDLSQETLERYLEDFK